MSEVAEALPVNSRSAILQFLREEPGASQERIDSWLGAHTSKPCRCGALLRRFESFNGICDRCHAGDRRAEPEVKHAVRLSCGIPPKHVEDTFASWRGDLPPSIRGNGEPANVGLREWAANPSGFALLVGVNGAGKTHAATAVLIDCLERDYSCRWYSARFLANDLVGESFNQPPVTKTWNAATRCELLLLDDLGTERSSEPARERIAELLDRRYLDKLPTIVTTNIDGKDLFDREPRIASRLVSGLVFKFVGRDARRHGVA